MHVDAVGRPRFKSCIEPIAAGDGLFLLSEGRHTWMPEPIFTALAPMLDGTHEVETIFETLSESYAAEQVFAALDHLRIGGYLAEDAAVEPRPARAFWEHLGVAPSLARLRLDAARVATVAFGDVELAPIGDLLKLQGLNRADEAEVALVVTDDYLRPELSVWNSQSLATGKSWLLVKPVGIETWIGPMFLPGRTACWECLAQRLRGHRKLQEYLARRSGSDAPVGIIPTALASTAHGAMSDAVTEITCFVGTGGQSGLVDRVVSTNVLTLERSQHTLIRRPQCPSCGSRDLVNRAHAGPVQLGWRPKLHQSDGGDRALDQREVLRRLERHLSPITGIVSRLVPGERAAVSGGAAKGLTVTFAADHNFSEMYDDRFFLREGLRRRSGGKGKSVDQARASALAESLERYCGVFDGTEPRIRSSFAKLGKAAVHPNACMCYSERQYAQREANNRRGHKAYWVPQPLREDVEIDWTPLWSLPADEPRYLPTSFCYYGYQSADPLFARADSNGCAAGCVIEEAVLQGVLELIERDAVALWWYNRLRRPGLDLKAIDDTFVCALVRHYGELRRELWVLDVTSDLGVPVFAALSKRTDKPEEDIIYGFGAHLDARIALRRALTELSQSLEAVPTLSGPDSTRTYRGNEEAMHWWRTIRVADAGYLAPDLAAGPRRLDQLNNLASDDLGQDVSTCKELLGRRGIDLLVLDQTRPDIAFPVVRVVAPGLRHFWARFGPGRLYDVPLREGWISRPLSEEEMNPFVIQF
jgi:ribosomal protein S12 methylthiotransferase accessory factor